MSTTYDIDNRTEDLLKEIRGRLHVAANGGVQTLGQAKWEMRSIRDSIIGLLDDLLISEEGR